jgi:predicted RNA-binding Zn-ribbon protein involved in translation (DUF1610 family)
MTLLLFHLLALLASMALVAGAVAAEEASGTLRGEVTIVGQASLRDGEVVVSPVGTHEVAGTAGFDSDDPTYEVDLPPGDYTAYAWAPVFHNSSREGFAVVANETTWLNLTVVRLEELIGTVVDTDGDPVDNALVELYSDGARVETMSSDANGRFRHLVDPGPYHVVIARSGFEGSEDDVQVEPGQVVEVTFVLEPVPEDDGGGEFPIEAAFVLVFIMLVAGGSMGYFARQARRMRRAAAEAEASRTRDFACPKCSTRMPEGANRCPDCGHVVQVRCEECSRSVDAGTRECPECGASLP